MNSTKVERSEPEIVAAFPANVRIAKIPRVSLSQLQEGNEDTSRTLFDACREYGFFHLDLDDGQSTIGSALTIALKDVFDLNRELHQLPEATKAGSAYAPPSQLFGWKALGRNKVEDGNPDRYEAWTIARDDLLDIPRSDSPNAGIPARPPLELAIRNRRSQLIAYVNAAHNITLEVCAHLDKHLSLPLGTLAGMQRLDCPSQTSLRLLRYLPHLARKGSLPHSLVGHTDIGTITVLAHNGVGGLQVLQPGKDNRDENWEYVKPEKGCVIVNLGDAMAEWSGGILRSDLHRVVAAPGDQSKTVRYSAAYLVRPENHAVMAPLKSEWKGSGVVSETPVWSAIEWERRKSEAIISGKDVARSKGGSVVERYSS